MIIVILLSVFGAGIVIFLVLRPSPDEPMPKPHYPMYTIHDVDVHAQSSESNATTVWARADTTAM